MASRSTTRNKIQALLSSFLHDKDDNIKDGKSANNDISENPGVLSTLCQPRNRESFYERVETFSPFTWFMKPLYLSPQHCALYGWENTDVDLLTCVSCKASLDGTVGTDWDPDMYNSICIKLKNNIINGHSKFCPWKDSPCPESFLSLPAKSALEWKQHFQLACKNLLAFGDDLPVLKREAFQEMELTEDTLSVLSSNITECDNESYHQDIFDTVCVMALCGWNTSDKDGSGILSCSACHREAGLWNFNSIKSLSQIKSGGKETIECPEQAVASQECPQGSGNEGGTVATEGEGGKCMLSEETPGSGGEMMQEMTHEGGVTQDKEDTQRIELDKDEEMSCEVGITRDSEDILREEMNSEEKMSYEVHGITGDNRDTQDKEIGTEDVSCEGGNMRGNENIQEEQLGTEEGMSCEEGMTKEHKGIQTETKCQVTRSADVIEGPHVCEMEAEDDTTQEYPSTIENNGGESSSVNEAILTVEHTDTQTTDEQNDKITCGVKESSDVIDSVSSSLDAQASEEVSKNSDKLAERATSEENGNSTSDQTVPEVSSFGCTSDNEESRSPECVEVENTSNSEIDDLTEYGNESKLEESETDSRALREQDLHQEEASQSEHESHPEQESLSEQEPPLERESHPEQESISEQEPPLERESHPEQESLSEQEPPLERKSHPEQEPSMVESHNDQELQLEQDLPEQESHSEQEPPLERKSHPEQEPSMVESHNDQELQLEQDLHPEQESHSEQEPLLERKSNSEQEPSMVESHNDQELQLEQDLHPEQDSSAQEPLPEQECLNLDEEPQSDSEIATDSITVTESETLSENPDPADIAEIASHASSDQDLEEYNVEMRFNERRYITSDIEPSRLFGAAVFSPVHSRQDSLIVEVGEDSLSERMQSIQSELEDTGEASSLMQSSRSLSEWSDSESEEPNLKRFKTDVEKVEFDVLAEHRNWCPWVTAVPSLNPNNTAGMVQKYPGWQLLLQNVIQCSSPGKPSDTQEAPPSQVWKSVQRLFHDCHETILRGTATKLVHNVERKV